MCDITDRNTSRDPVFLSYHCGLTGGYHLCGSTSSVIVAQSTRFSPGAVEGCSPMLAIGRSPPPLSEGIQTGSVQLIWMMFWPARSMTRSSMKRTRRHHGCAEGSRPIWVDIRQPASNAASFRTIPSSSTCGSGSVYTCRSRPKRRPPLCCVVKQCEYFAACSLRSNFICVRFAGRSG